MFDVVIIGTGNLAFHLCKTLNAKNMKFSLLGRNQHALDEFKMQFHCRVLNSYTEINKDSFVFACVPDQAIHDLVQQIPSNLKLVFTSGAIQLNALPKRQNIGIFYPLQTFSKEKEVDFKNIPILIETENKEFEFDLEQFSLLLSKKVYFVNSEKRQFIHLSAVICNNFTNHLHVLAKKMLHEQDIDFSILFPLLQETIDKIVTIGPENAQTGPARRNDRNTINGHLKLISDTNNLKTIYQQITNSILETNGYEKL